MSNLIFLDNYRKNKLLNKKSPIKKIYKKRNKFKKIKQNKNNFNSKSMDTPFTDKYLDFFSDTEKELLSKFKKEDHK